MFGVVARSKRKRSYAPQSGAIFGILKQMKETFETNLSQAQKDELSAQDAYNELKTAKLAEISASKKAVPLSFKPIHHQN